jgi:hypothetical protein
MLEPRASDQVAEGVLAGKRPAGGKKLWNFESRQAEAATPSSWDSVRCSRGVANKEEGAVTRLEQVGDLPYHDHSIRDASRRAAARTPRFHYPYC